MLAIERRGGSIFLTDSMGVDGISQSLGIGCTHLRGEDRRGRTPFSERMVDDSFRCHCQDAFRKRLRLGKERPRPVAQRQSRIGPVPYRRRRHDVENGEAGDALRMVKSHAIRDATATVMTGASEAPKAKLPPDD